MQFAFTNEQRQFRDVARRFLAEASPPAEVRRLMETDAGFDPAVWHRLNDELGLGAAHVPERYGGQGYSFVELGIVLEEMGRALLCAPYLSSAVLAAGAVLHGGTEAQKQELLPHLASGKRRGALAVIEPNGRWDAGGIGLLARRSGAGYRLEGEKSFVLDGCTAELIVVAARAPGSEGEAGVALFLVAGQAEGLERRPLRAIDATRKLARLTFCNVPAQRLGEEDTGSAALQRVLAEAAVALASEMVGGAQQMLDSAVEYVKLRMQFGRQIGSFQAVKHRCADMLLEVELAKSAAYRAAAAVAEGDPRLPALASLACASEACMNAAAGCIQLHGGVGFTWDNDTHLWFKRAQGSAALFGDAAWHREAMMRHWQ